MLTTALITTTTPLHALSDTPTRTIFDEERELFEKRQTEAAEARVSALRAAFEAVEKSEAQLDDVPKFVSDKDWNGVRKFSRLFNNSVEREGMEGIAKKLDLKEVRKDALALCKQVSKELQQLDRLAGREEGDAVLKQAEHVKELVASFQRFKP